MVEIQLSNKTTSSDDSNIQKTQSIETNKKDHPEVYDVLIIGSGPAGYTSGIYSVRYNLKTILIGEEQGGQMNIEYDIENYPGFRKIKGRELMEKIDAQARDLGVEVVLDKVEDVKKENNGFKITTMFSIYHAKKIILALGTKRRKLNVKGEDKYIARGVSYCATCDGAFFKNKIVAVIGGGNSAFASAHILSQHAKKVYLIHRRSEFRADPAVIDQAKQNSKIEFITPANVLEIQGKGEVEKIITDNSENKEIKLNGVFIEVGTIPITVLAKELGIECDNADYIKVNKEQETNVSGIYAAGDITTGSNKLKQIVTAQAEGAIAATSMFKKLTER